ncbi:TonB-dependent receptor domain-containing protein [Silanimonas lenta]|uniref:TonB-dependent receptor domain-containing protein n=1 Tax=Silanimonas lenta TaxID=265429 RepID=UPI0009FC18E3|nr:TonB-dependent receptor [Silanimonas lenta]
MAVPAFAQAPQQTGEEKATTLERIEVVGSRIRGVDLENAQPVISLSRDQIEAQGLTSIGDVIQNLAANGATLNTNFNNGGNGETRVNLRNLGSARTLVLVNGRRWVGGTGLGGAVDLNTIPTAAVERIEVLKDGASSIYGSDAIAGVVNIILRTEFQGAEANAYLGQFSRGDGSRQSYDATIGALSDRSAVMLGIGYVKEEPVMAGNREISAVPLFGSTPGFRGSSTTPNGRYAITPDGGTTLLNPGATPGSTVNAGNFFVPTGPNSFRPWGGTTENYNFAPDNYLLTPQERTSVFGHARFDLTDTLRFVTTVTYNERISEQLLAAMPLVLGVPAAGTASADIVISRDSIYNPYGVDVNWIQRRVVETGGRSFNQNVKTFAFNGRFEGEFDVGDRSFSWDAGYFYGKNDQTDVTRGLFNVPALRQALGPSFINAQGVATCGTPAAPISGCVPLNLLGGGAGTITPDMLRFVGFEAKDVLGYEQISYFANVTGGLFELPAGTMAFAAGAEHRREEGFDRPDALIASGNTTGNARTPTGGGYSLDELYLELQIPLLADRPFAKSLDLNLASRYSDYSNFGDTTNSKASLTWRPVSQLLVRANWAEGFRAPSILELFQGVSDNFPQATDPCNTAGFGGLTPEAQARCVAGGVPVGGYSQANSQIRTLVGGNPNLQPESSRSKTFGFVYSPEFVEGLDVSLDWWNIRIEDAIAQLSAQTILNSCYRGNAAAVAQFCPIIQRAPGGIISSLNSVSRNIGINEFEGYDLTLTYRLPESSFGQFSINWDNTILTDALVDENGDGRVTEDPVTGEGGNRVGEYYDRNPYWRIRSNLSLRWTRGDFAADVSARYYSGMDESCESLRTAPGGGAAQVPLVCSNPTRRTQLDGQATSVLRPENYIPSVTYTDVVGHWKAPWNARISIGVNNIFDRDPPFSAITFANSFDPQYEVPGRFYYMRYSQSF